MSTMSSLSRLLVALFVVATVSAATSTVTVTVPVSAPSTAVPLDPALFSFSIEQGAFSMLAYEKYAWVDVGFL